MQLSMQIWLQIAYIEVSEKNVFENAVCLSRLLYIFANIIDQCKCRSKDDDPDLTVQSGSLLYDHIGLNPSKTFQQMTKADDFCCN